MAEVEFAYNGVNTTIQCNLNEKLKDICQRFKDKVGLNNTNTHYPYNGQVGIEEEKKFKK